ncbi:hypothetical protein JCM11641_002333 [Rhodosporidiobolus odoratus]
MSSSSTPSSSPSKRRPLSEEFKTTTVQVARATEDKPEWYNMGKRSKGTRFLGLPARVLDIILSDSALNLRDHLSLACVCRTLRACYYTALSPSSSSQPTSSLWAGLIALRPSPIDGKDGKQGEATAGEKRAVRKIWSGGVRNDPLTMEVVGKQPEAVSKKGGKREIQEMTGWEGRAIISYEWERATLLVHSAKMTKTDVKKHYKLTDKELSMLKCVVKPNPYARRSGAPMRLYTEAAVESLALRLHGGVYGHRYFLARRAASASKAAETRARNGTKPGGNQQRTKKQNGMTYEQLLLAAELDELYGGELGYYDGGYEYEECGW